MTPSNPDSDRRSEGRKPDDSGKGTAQQKIEQDAQNAKREASDKAREQARAGQHQATDKAEALSEAIDAAATNLDDQDREGLARYARDLSNNLSNAAGQLEDRSVDELASDAKHLARKNPALFVLGSIAVGFGLSRFLKASAERDHDEEKSDQSAHMTHEHESLTGAPLPRHAPNTTEASPVPPNGNGRDLV